MANGVSVEGAAVQGGIACCKTSIHELETAARGLKNSYQQAGSGGWKDQKYAALGGIVDECANALTKPIAQLEDCIQKLEALAEAINRYESTRL